jgi:hypothetical protein
MLDSKALLDVTAKPGPAYVQKLLPSLYFCNSLIRYNLSTHDLPRFTMPLRRFFLAGEAERAHPAALASQGEFLLDDAESKEQNKNGGVLASNVMHLSALKHLQELWQQRRREGVPWYVNHVCLHHNGMTPRCRYTLTRRDGVYPPSLDTATPPAPLFPPTSTSTKPVTSIFDIEHMKRPEPAKTLQVTSHHSLLGVKSACESNVDALAAAHHERGLLLDHNVSTRVLAPSSRTVFL